MASISMAAARADARSLAGVRQDVAKLLLRVSVSALIMVRGWAVLHGEQAIRDTLMRWGMPTQLAYASIFFEEIAPLMVILGVYARVGASAMTFWMLMAFALAHVDTGHLFELDAAGVGWRVEGPFFFLVCSLSVALLGAGRYGLNIGGKWND
jgi:putative oxidoreductase